MSARFSGLARTSRYSSRWAMPRRLRCHWSMSPKAWRNEGPGRRAVWCALAEEVEQFRDRHPGRELDEEVERWREPGLHADRARPHDLLARAPELVAAGDQLSADIDPLRELTPGGWAVQLGQVQELAPRVPEPVLEQGLGMGLGW